MDDKVKELVEWLAEKLYKQRWYEGQPLWENSQLKGLFRNYAKQILSHPDLALIDREKLENTVVPDWVIPLAEVLKEIK